MLVKSSWTAKASERHAKCPSDLSDKKLSPASPAPCWTALRVLTRQHDVAATNELALDVHLGDSWPVADRSAPYRQSKRCHSPVLLDALTQLWVLKTVEGHNLLTRNTLHLEDLANCSRETTLGRLGCSLHEDYQWVLLHGLAVSVSLMPKQISTHTVDELPGLVRQQSALSNACADARHLGAWECGLHVSFTFSLSLQVCEDLRVQT